MSRAEREALFHKCAKTMTSQSITGWFLCSPGRQIWRDNVVDWLLWALFSARTSEGLPEWEEELDYYTTVMGEYVGYPLRPGTNSEMQCLRLTMDRVHMVHRPFVWYMVSFLPSTQVPHHVLLNRCWQIVCIVDTFTSIQLYSHGFTHYNTRKWFHAFPPRPLLALFSRPSTDTVTNISYWYRPHRSRTKLPILFFHGIGIGLLPYVPFFRELAAQDPDVGILAVEILPISMHITEPPLARDAMCDAITRILNAHELRRIVLAGHSYGTAISAFLLRRQWGSVDRPLPASPMQGTNHVANHAHDGGRDGGGDDLIAATLLMDPIPFLLHYPAVAYNFVYRKPRRSNEWQLWYFASRDADIARALSRHFFWFESVLFREDVLRAARAKDDGVREAVSTHKPMPVTVMLAGRDQIVDAPAVRAYLSGGDEQATQLAEGAEGSPSRWAQDELEVLYFPELDHATVLDTPQRRAPLLRVLRRFVRLDEEEVQENGNGTAEGVADVGRLVDVN
jgi:pimeloyl-ACP methyl ester carboxylesterase